MLTTGKTEMPIILISRDDWITLITQISELRGDVWKLRGDVWKLRTELRAEKEIIMATQDEIDALNVQVTANTNATQAAAAALTGFVKTVADLTAKLEAAVASNDSSAIQAATAALKANNDALTAAVPATATAVTANTPAA